MKVYFLVEPLCLNYGSDQSENSIYFSHTFQMPNAAVGGITIHKTKYFQIIKETRDDSDCRKRFYAHHLHFGKTS